MKSSVKIFLGLLFALAGAFLGLTIMYFNMQWLLNIDRSIDDYDNRSDNDSNLWSFVKQGFFWFFGVLGGVSCVLGGIGIAVWLICSAPQKERGHVSWHETDSEDHKL